MNTQAPSPSSPSKALLWAPCSRRDRFPQNREREGFGNNSVNDAFVTTCERHCCERRLNHGKQHVKRHSRPGPATLTHKDRCGDVVFMTLVANGGLASLGLTPGGLGRCQFQQRCAPSQCYLVASRLLREVRRATNWTREVNPPQCLLKWSEQDDRPLLRPQPETETPCPTLHGVRELAKKNMPNTITFIPHLTRNMQYFTLLN